MVSRAPVVYGYPGALLALVGSFIFPVLEAFTREERIKRVLQESLLQPYLDTNHQKIEACLAQDYEFYTSHADEISLKLDQVIDKLEASLDNLSGSGVDHLTVVADSKRKIRATIEDFRKAKQELENAVAFYKQFDDEILEA